MAEVVRYVDPDASGVGDGTSWTDAYTSLSACEADERADLVTAGDWLHIYVRASAGTIDNTIVIFNSDNWTCDADSYILVEAAEGDEATKDGWDTSRYRLHTTDAAGALLCYFSFIRFKNMQIRNDYSSETGRRVVYYAGVSSGSDLQIDGCRIESNGGSNYHGLQLNDDDIDIQIQNTIIRNCGGSGIDCGYGATIDLWQSVICDCATGVDIDDLGATVEIKNCAIFDCTDDISDTSGATIDYVASDDGDGTNSVSPSGSDWDNEYTDYANGDVTLLNTGNCYHGGATITGGPTYDIDGDEWDGSTPSIGVDEYAAAGGTTMPIFLHHYKMAGGL